jgi:hypothetical protein
MAVRSYARRGIQLFSPPIAISLIGAARSRMKVCRTCGLESLFSGVLSHLGITTFDLPASNSFLNQSQKITFNPNWISREGIAVVSAAPAPPVGLPS